MRHEEIEKAEAAVETAKSALKDLESEILTANRDRYEAAGGCRACLGEGVTWQHYHDGDSAKSVCYACGGKCDKSIVYDGDRFKDPETQTRYDGAYEDLKLAKLFFERAQELYSLGKGVTVEVVKGRKVRKGTRGVVIAESTMSFSGHVRSSVLIKVIPDEYHVIATEEWTSVNNVRVVAPRADV